MAMYRYVWVYMSIYVFLWVYIGMYSTKCYCIVLYPIHADNSVTWCNFFKFGILFFLQIIRSVDLLNLFLQQVEFKVST